MSFPPLHEVVPHRGPMALLDRILAHDEARTVCAVRPRASALFADARGQVPAWVGLEYMAQCVAAHAGLLARARGEEPGAGLFLGTRRLVIRADAFGPDEELEVEAAPRGAVAGGLAGFACTVRGRGGEPLLEGSVAVARLDALPGAAEVSS